MTNAPAEPFRFPPIRATTTLKEVGELLFNYSEHCLRVGKTYDAPDIDRENFVAWLYHIFTTFSVDDVSLELERRIEAANFPTSELDRRIVFWRKSFGGLQ